MMNDGARRTAYHQPLCALTICEVDMVPAHRNTATNDRPIAIS